jgi:hypothetical protein
MNLKSIDDGCSKGECCRFTHENRSAIVQLCLHLDGLRGLNLKIENKIA